MPLVAHDEVIGVLQLRSKKVNAYTERDVALAERVADQIAGAIANALLHSERRRAEEELRSHRDHLEEQVAERTQELAHSNRALEEFANVASHDLQEPLRKV